MRPCALALGLLSCALQLSCSTAPVAHQGASATEPAHPTTASTPAPSATLVLAAAEEAPPARPEPAQPEPAVEEAPAGMLLVPAGTTTIGQDSRGEQDERPAHPVTLGAFWLDRTEVTNEDYARCVSAGICRPHDERSARLNKVGDDRSFRKPLQPISAVSWDDASAYCAWVGKRLPREVEWERAARGDDGRLYPWGSTKPTREHAVFGEATTAEVGSRAAGAGPFGHLDLAGNVWEWVEDAYDPYAYRRPSAAEGKPGSCEEILETQDELRKKGQQGFTGTNPIPTKCERVLRGGAFNYPGPGLRASNRVHHGAEFRLVMSGFRCAKNAR